MKEKKINLKESLHSRDDFLSLLQQEACSDEYRKLKQKAGKEIHPKELLHLYVLGELDNESEQKVRGHISLCGECAKEVLQIRQAEEESEQEILKWADTPTPIQHIKQFKDKLRDFFIIPEYRPYAVCMTTIICLMSLFLVHKYLTRNPLENLISKSYKTVLMHKDAFKNNKLNRILSILGDDPDRTFGFSPSKPDDPVYLALRAGMLSGRHKLFRQDNKEKEEWSSEFAGYFHTGEWVFLIRAVCLSDADVPKAFWKQQQVIITELLKDFSENKKITAELESIQNILEESEIPGKIQQQRLAYKIENFIDFLIP